jgi:hypothetical protein
LVMSKDCDFGCGPAALYYYFAKSLNFVRQKASPPP